MSKTIILEITPELSGRKIEAVLEKHLRLSRTLITRLKRTDGAVLLNGEETPLIRTVEAGDILAVNVLGKYTDGIISVKMELDILLEDDDMIAVNKPAGMPAHPSGQHKTDTLANGVMYHLGEKTAFHVITRLDRETSGVVIIAKNAHSAKLLTEKMKNGNIQKEYIALINGTPNPIKGQINAPIRKEEGRSIKRIVSPDGKEALSTYEVIGSRENLSLIKLNPITGRTHQLRVHMAHIGHSIYGDEMYGAPQRGERTRLHCHRISFIHPMTEKEITVKSPIPDDIENLFKSLGEDV